MSNGIQFDPEAIRALAQILRDTDLTEIELVELTDLDHLGGRCHRCRLLGRRVGSIGQEAAGRNQGEHHQPGRGDREVHPGVEPGSGRDRNGPCRRRAPPPP